MNITPKFSQSKEDQDNYFLCLTTACYSLSRKLMLRIYTALARPVVGDLSTIWIPTQSRRSVASRADTMQRRSLLQNPVQTH